MNVTWPLVVGLLATTALADTPVTPKAPYGAVAIIEKPVAMVGTTILWSSEVDARMVPIPDKSTRPKIVDEMIDELVYLARAAELRITVEDSEIKMALEEIKRQNGIDDAALDKALAEQGYTRKRYEVDVGRQILRLRVRNQDLMPRFTITKDEIEAEIAKQGLALTDENRRIVEGQLKMTRAEKITEAWLAIQRKRIHVERFP